ncbi:His-Xaa-Ser system radical SAM maturase HxsC [Paludibaculum fermentans]|uniref:His-Xaa-Ser system radical SAM maturase HxsC n=1 Tax=Paludibaculum fermentans TaxID=1473598 RepID=UPI003EB94DC9
MRLTTQGNPFHIREPIVGRASTSPCPEFSDPILLTDATGFAPPQLQHCRALLTTAILDPATLASITIPIVHGLRDIDHLDHGDIVLLDGRGEVRTLFRPASIHNTLFLTERCNSNCLMCSQPPKDTDDTAHFLRVNKELVQLIPPDTDVLGITGGEPTLLRDGLIELLSLLKERLPNTHLHLLTNGRLFAWPLFTERLAAVDHQKLVLGIPLYGDVATIHDYIVQARGAFDQTITGLHHLARFRRSIELRVVLHKLTVPRLRELVEFVYRNLPFVEHVALMGLEPIGHATHHRDKLWIDPFDYRDALAWAVEYLTIRGMRVSIYNLQRCVLPEVVWPFARKSISDWKNMYLPECTACGDRDSCGGFFASAQILHSEHIRPLSIR